MQRLKALVGLRSRNSCSFQRPRFLSHHYQRPFSAQPNYAPQNNDVEDQVSLHLSLSICCCTSMYVLTFRDFNACALCFFLSLQILFFLFLKWNPICGSCSIDLKVFEFACAFRFWFKEELSQELPFSTDLLLSMLSLLLWFFSFSYIFHHFNLVVVCSF